MEVIYKNKKTEKQCENFSQARKDFGNEVAEKLMSRINYIKSANCFSDIVEFTPLHFHKLKGNKKDEFAIDVTRKSGYRIILEPLDENGNSLKKENDINILKKCTQVVLILEVTNHYE